MHQKGARGFERDRDALVLRERPLKFQKCTRWIAQCRSDQRPAPRRGGERERPVQARALLVEAIHDLLGSIELAEDDQGLSEIRDEGERPRLEDPAARQQALRRVERTDDVLGIADRERDESEHAPVLEPQSTHSLGRRRGMLPPLHLSSRSSTRPIKEATWALAYSI